jgi:PAS domain S-box-containing protein
MADSGSCGVSEAVSCDFLELRLDTSLRCVSSRSDGPGPFGLSQPGMVGKYFPECLAPAEATTIVEILRGVVENPIGAVITASFETAQGMRWLELNVVPVEGEPDDGASIEIVFREPPFRRDGYGRVETSIRSNNLEPTPAAMPMGGGVDERFRVLVDHMRESVCEMDEHGLILYANPSYAECFGGSPERLIGSDPLDPVHVDDRRRVSRLLRPGAASSRRSTLAYRARDRKGVLLQLEATACEFLGSDHRPRVVVVTRDVTERETARRALERHIDLETRVAELSRFFIDVEIDAIGEGIGSRLARVAELANAEHSWIYSFSTGRNGFEVFEWWREEQESRKPRPAEEAIETFPYSTGLIQSGRVYQVTDVEALPAEAANEREDMRRRGVRSILGIPIMSGGRFVGFLGFESFDREINWPEETIMLLRMVGEIFYSALRRRRAVEDLRLSQNQLLQSQKMEAVGTLAGGIAHDFNNHLAVMLGNARFVRQEAKAPADVISAIEDIERSADHCAQLTRSLLTFSRRSPVQVLPVAVSDLVEGVDGLVRPLLPSDFQLETSLAPDVGFFAVDRVQIQQVLVNLLVNARDAMSDGGRIRLEAVRRSLVEIESEIEGLDPARDYVVLSVEDDGHGMDEATLGRIFEPFFTTKGVGHGTGLGLAMAYGIVRQSEGAITAESRHGRGSVFRVYLPGTEG